MKKLVLELQKRGFHKEAAQVQEVIAKGWETLPRGWTKKSAQKFWNNLTGDRQHRITQCIDKMSGKMNNPGAFCGSLAKLIGYTPKLKKDKKGPWWLKK